MFYKCNNCGFEFNSVEDAENCPNCMQPSVAQLPYVKIGPGEIIAGFKLIKRLGQGGMGEVWQAEQLSMERLVALKILKPEMGNTPNFRNRFINEIKHSAKLEHPNIVTAFDAGQYKGLYYLASSFIKGKQLMQKLDEEKIIEEKEALSIALGIAKALDYAWNEFNMLHRDIKPGNIIVDTSFVPKLLDMGIAKTVTEDKSLTMDGDLVGTPFYISPEQAKAEQLDCRSDMYSLGATLYHLTTGAIPFNGDTPMGIITKHITEKLTSPIERNPALSMSTNNLIIRMMEKDMNDRFQSWREVIDCIESILTGEVYSDENNLQQSYNEQGNTRKEPENTSLVKVTRIKLKENAPAESQVIKKSSGQINEADLENEQKEKKVSKPSYLAIFTAIVFIAAVLFGLYCLCFLPGDWRNTTDKALSRFAFALIAQFQIVFNNSSKISGSVELRNIVCCSLIPVALLFSAFLSAALAEKHSKSRICYFLLGMLFPFAFPFLIAKRR